MEKATATLRLYVVDDGGERHHAVAASPEAAIRAVSESLLGHEDDLMVEHPNTEASPVPDDEKLTVHYAEDPGLGREISGRCAGLSVRYDYPDDSGTAYVSGQASDWVQAHREQAPAFIGSTVF